MLSVECFDKLASKLTDNGSPYRCHLCSFDSVDVVLYKDHLKTHMTTKKEAINYELAAAVALKEAASREMSRPVVVEGQAEVQCGACEMRSADPDEVATHFEANHDPPLLLKCTRCEIQTRGATVMRYHIESTENHQAKVKNDEALWLVQPRRLQGRICELCGYVARSSCALRNHKDSHEADSFPCKVEGCSFRGKYRSSVESHYRCRHTEAKKKLQCHICGYSADKPTRLRQHMNTHTKEKPIQCNECDYRCGSQALLYKHRRTIHQGKVMLSSERKVCEICGRTVNAAHLRKHIMRHLGTEPFKCKVPGCHFGGVDRPAYTRHMTRCHPPTGKGGPNRGPRKYFRT